MWRSVPHVPLEGRAVVVECALGVEDVDELQVVALAAVVVVGVVRRRDLDRTRAERHVHLQTQGGGEGVRGERGRGPTLDNATGVDPF